MTRGYRGGYSSSRGSSSYRGSSNRGNSWHGNSRGGYSSNRGGGGRFSSNYSSSSYDSRKYSNSDKFGSSRRDGDYRKPYKNDSGYPSHRDRSPPRKRMRSDSNHDRNIGGGGGGSGDYKNNRYEPDRRSFSNERRSSSAFARKEEFRKPPPPPSSPRGGYRGRVSSRGPLRTRLRDRPVRKRLIESSYNVRRRVISGRTSDFARRLKISRMRSSIASRPKKSSPEKNVNDSSDEKKKDENSTDAKSKDAESDNKKNSKKSPKRNEKDDDDDDIIEEDATSDKESKKHSDDEKDVSSRSSNFMSPMCPHCHTKSATIGKYSLHLQSRRHVAAMRRLATKQKSILSQMRLVQREAQRELERTTSDLAPRTSWCPLCKLNYKQPKATHQASASHLEMKKFLMPHCKVCRITFKSPMVYESHCCSIDHLERSYKQRINRNDKDDSGNEEDALESFTTIDSVGDIDGAESSDKKDSEGEKPKENVNVGIESIRKVEVHYCDLCRMYLTRVTDEAEASRIIAQHCKQRTHLQKYIRHKEDKELAKKAERILRKETEQKEKEKQVKEDTATKATIKQEPTTPKAAPSEKNGGGGGGGTGGDGSALDDSNVEEEKPWTTGVGGTDGNDGGAGGNKSSDEDEEEEDSVVNGGRYDRFKGSEKGLEVKKPEPSSAAIEEELLKIETNEIAIDDAI